MTGTSETVPVGREYLVVINDEEQYSIWPMGRTLPEGWREAGFSGTRDACLDHVERAWTDMRPASLRRALEEPPAEIEPPLPAVEGPSLVERLSEGWHPLEVAGLHGRGLAGLREALERRYLLVRFTETRGGTELGLALEPAGINLSDADLDSGRGRLVLGADLELDFEALRCEVSIELESLAGRGRLVPSAGREVP